MKPARSASSYYYQFAPKPGGPDLLAQVLAAAASLHVKLSSLNLKTIGISEYNQRYLGFLLRRMPGALEDYTHLLMCALQKHPRCLSEFMLVDYGGGSGLLSLLAREAGIGSVLYLDVYDVSCNDARTIAARLGLLADEYVCGDVDDLIQHFGRTPRRPDAVVSFNVIEHVYDVTTFLRKLCACAGETCSIVMGSSANTLNPRTRLLTMRHQRLVELQDRERVWGHKNRDSLQSYLAIRRDLIKSAAPRLSPAIVEILAKRTRGLAAPDILAAVKTYQATSELPPEPEHPTNTCDPLTGNWDEHLLDPFMLLDQLESHGFRGQVLTGYYPRRGNLPKQCVTRILNAVISRSSWLGLRLAPHYVVCANNYEEGARALSRETKEFRAQPHLQMPERATSGMGERARMPNVR
jgi:2-polyprenyl-3-methyl-5-hydroxy-6-metoxy-1,4-benzoquinol methylase